MTRRHCQHLYLHNHHHCHHQLTNTSTPAVIKAKEGVVTLKVRRGGSEQLVTFYKAAAATRTGIALES